MYYQFLSAVISTTKEEKSVASKHEISRSCFLRNDRKLKLKLLLLFVLVAFCVHAQVAKRVISLTPSITENIYLIGAEDKLVGCTTYCTEAVKDGVQQVGSAVNVNVEKVFALQPDLVLTMGLTKSQDLEAMKKLGIRVVLIETPKTFEEICEQTLHIAKLVGYSAEAEEIVQQTKATVADIRQKSSRSDKLNMFFQIGANPIFTVLQNTFMDDFITICNGQNIADGMTKGTITRESVLVKNPDVIVIATMGGFGAEEQKVWNTYKGMSAVKKEKVFIISSETSCSPTPANFVSALEDVYRFVSQ